MARALAFAFVVAAACTPITSFELEQESSKVIPDFDGKTRVEVGDISGREVFDPLAADRGGGSAENLRVIGREENLLAQEEDARIGTKLTFQIDGVAYGIRVEDFHIGTFTDDTMTLIFFAD